MIMSKDKGHRLTINDLIKLTNQSINQSVEKWTYESVLK